MGTCPACFCRPLECAEEAAEEVGEFAVDVAVEASTPVAFVDALIGPIHFPIALISRSSVSFLTQVATIDSNCSLGNMIGLTALNSMNLAVGLAGKPAVVAGAAAASSEPSPSGASSWELK